MADDPSPDWRLLAPHRPLSLGDGAYVARPTGGGDAIATWVIAGGSTVLVSGPTGVGKSTELVRAAEVLDASRVACLVQVDRFTNMHKLTADLLMRIIAARLVELARDRLRLPISDELEAAAIVSSEEVDVRHLTSKLFRAGGVSTVRAAVAEVVRLSPQGRVALLIDGLEKLLPGAAAREIFDALSQISESVDLVVVIPWHAAFGGGTEPILRVGERLHRVVALETEGDAGLVAAEFLARVLASKLRRALPESLILLAARAFKTSGGLPRVFLQLMADAGTYARVKRGIGWPDTDDLQQAILDQQDSFRRALLPGDTQAIVAVEGTDGRELDLERRVRLLAQGILLERVRDGGVSLEVHPLVIIAVGRARS